jgi:hypothetical protein
MIINEKGKAAPGIIPSIKVARNLLYAYDSDRLNQDK